MTAQYIGKRLLSALPVLLIVSLIAFFLLHLVPGDPAAVIAGDSASPEQIDAIRAQLHLDQPLYVQLLRWFAGVLHGDLGDSISLQQSVLSSIGESLPVTLALAAYAMLLSVPIGLLAGAAAAYWRGTWIDTLIMTSAMVGVSIPNFWLGLLTIILFAVHLGWLPAGQYVSPHVSISGWIACLTLPAFCLAAFQVGFLVRITRSAMLEVLNQDYIRTARAKGISEIRTVLKHAMRNVMIPVVTTIGLILNVMISGAVVVEQTFTLPGLGTLVVNGVLSRDYPLIQGALLVIAAIFLLINLTVDLLYTYLDPRVGHG
jgi:peptide/nickel transport system permease protein